MIEALILVVFPFCMVYAVVSDTMSMTIANRVPLLLLGTFLIVAPFTGLGWAEIGMHLAAGGFLLLVTFALFALGGMGGGDAKLIAATAVWMGLGFPLMQYLLVSAFVGGTLTLAILAFRSTALSHVVGQNVFLRNFTQDAGGVPYGIALGIGGLLAYPTSPMMTWALGRLIAQ